MAWVEKVGNVALVTVLVRAFTERLDVYTSSEKNK